MHIQEHKIRQQLTGKGRNIQNEKVLNTMLSIPRHWFLPIESRHQAYEDCALPIGYDQTISQPYMVAMMTELLSPQPNHKILEIGTGSGYHAAVLSKLAGDVFTIERIEPLL